MIRVILIALAMLAITLPAPAQTPQARVEQLIARSQEESKAAPFDGLFPPGTKVVAVEQADDYTTVVFNQYLGWRPWFGDSAEELRDALREALGISGNLDIMIEYEARRNPPRYPFETHITTPESIREREAAREIPPKTAAAPVVQRVDYAGPQRTGGLENRNVVVAPSHGWLWHKDNRWQFQRARIQTTVEDMHPAAYANPFLIPMLENAGAVVFPVRERDYQTAETIVDNDGADSKGQLILRGEWRLAEGQTGWRGGVPASLGPDTEPFKLGTVLRAQVGTAAEAVYVPYIPRAGRYAVYVAWAMDSQNSPAVPVKVRHLGGETEFKINQQIAGNTWIFLGFFEFEFGSNEETGSVVISTEGAATREPGGRERGNADTFVTIDAVRFGGGVGNVSAGGHPSGKPRHAEGAKYWMQYSGAPKDMIYDRGIRYSYDGQHFSSDYVQDYVGRTEWTNYLHGAPWGPNNFRNARGLGVPMDMYLSWHTDAGVDERGITGTLVIYSTSDAENNLEFPDGRSRWLNRDLASLIQEEIMRSARGEYTSTWKRRHIHNRELSETTRANVPSALIELLSHQNFNDMKYGLDPRFQFDISRAIYKAMLRFIAYSNGYEPIIQPLAPMHPAARHTGGGNIEITWRPQDDPLEPTAVADGYILYTSKDGKSFDNGQYAESTSTTVQIPEGEARYFRVTATNAGGESFPSPTVGARWKTGSEPILIVDGFDRIAGPSYFDKGDIAGFDRDIDPGVGYELMRGVVGDVYDYDKKSEWKNDLEMPGWGASDNSMEERTILGNDFSHIAKHGAMIADRAFDSANYGAYAQGFGDNYKLIDWIAGFQKATPPHTGMTSNGMADKMKTEFEAIPAPARARLREHVAAGGKLLISGAYVGQDLTSGASANDDSRAFAREILGIDTVTTDAVTVNAANAAAGAGLFRSAGLIRFGADLGPEINVLENVMVVHSAEAFGPAQGASALLRYPETDAPAAIGTANTLLIGFPIETIIPPATRATVYKAALEYLE